MFLKFDNEIIVPKYLENKVIVTIKKTIFIFIVLAIWKIELSRILMFNKIIEINMIKYTKFVSKYIKCRLW